MNRKSVRTVWFASALAAIAAAPAAHAIQTYSFQVRNCFNYDDSKPRDLWINSYNHDDLIKTIPYDSGMVERGATAQGRVKTFTCALYRDILDNIVGTPGCMVTGDIDNKTYTFRGPVEVMAGQTAVVYNSNGSIAVDTRSGDPGSCAGY